MQSHLQIPYPASELVHTHFADQDTKPARHARSKGVNGRQSRRDRFDYRLIFSVCLVISLGAVILERCNPFGKGMARGERKSIWQQSKEAAHLCTSIAMQV